MLSAAFMARTTLERRLRSGFHTWSFHPAAKNNAPAIPPQSCAYIYGLRMCADNSDRAPMQLCGKVLEGQVGMDGQTTARSNYLPAQI